MFRLLYLRLGCNAVFKKIKPNPPKKKTSLLRRISGISRFGNSLIGQVAARLFFTHRKSNSVFVEIYPVGTHKGYLRGRSYFARYREKRPYGDKSKQKMCLLTRLLPVDGLYSLIGVGERSIDFQPSVFGITQHARTSNPADG